MIGYRCDAAAPSSSLSLVPEHRVHHYTNNLQFFDVVLAIKFIITEVLVRAHAYLLVVLLPGNIVLKCASAKSVHTISKLC